MNIGGKVWYLWRDGKIHPVTGYHGDGDNGCWATREEAITFLEGMDVGNKGSGGEIYYNAMVCPKTFSVDGGRNWICMTAAHVVRKIDPLTELNRLHLELMRAKDEITNLKNIISKVSRYWTLDNEQMKLGDEIEDEVRKYTDSNEEKENQTKTAHN